MKWLLLLSLTFSIGVFADASTHCDDERVVKPEDVCTQKGGKIVTADDKQYCEIDGEKVLLSEMTQE
jgi:hypothetical protein